MSYMKFGYPLMWFNTGETKSYVYQSTDNCTVDYDDKYEDDKSFCELVYTFVLHETEDKKYAEKILRTLAKKLGVDKELRKEPLSLNDFLDKVIK